MSSCLGAIASILLLPDPPQCATLKRASASHRLSAKGRQPPSVAGARPLLEVACRPSVWQPARRARGRVGSSVQATGGAKILGSLTGAVGARARQHTSQP